MGVQADLGPTTPPRLQVYAMAVEIHTLARLALEFTAPGPSVDVPRALKQIARIRDMLGLDAMPNG